MVSIYYKLLIVDYITLQVKVPFLNSAHCPLLFSRGHGHLETKVPTGGSGVPALGKGSIGRNALLGEYPRRPQDTQARREGNCPEPMLEIHSGESGRLPVS